jgi:seryl-tRNA synthetase
MAAKKAETERDAIDIVHKETLNELETVRAALRQMEPHKQTKTMKQGNDKYRKLSHRWKEFSKRYEKQSADFESVITQLNEKLANLKAYNEELLAQNGQLKKELQELKAKCRDLQQEIEDYQNAPADEHRPAIEAARFAQDSLESQLGDELQQKQQQYDEASAPNCPTGRRTGSRRPDGFAAAIPGPPYRMLSRPMA